MPVNAISPAVSLLIFLLATNASHAQHHPEVQRFAKEGRARLASVALAGNRSTAAVIAGLCRFASQTRIAADQEAWRHSLHASDARRQVFHLIEVPPAARGTIRLQFETDDPEIRGSVLRAADFLQRIVSARWLPRSTIRVRVLTPTDPRPHATRGPDGSCIYVQPGRRAMHIAVHELAHHIEHDHPEVLDASKGFLTRRARGGPLVPLNALVGSGYDHDEVAYRSNWAERGGIPYSGKVYGPSMRDATATELISTGLERLLREPTGFLVEDADYLLFLVLTLQSMPP